MEQTKKTAMLVIILAKIVKLLVLNAQNAFQEIIGRPLLIVIVKAPSMKIQPPKPVLNVNIHA